jgi:hypothetical protein
MVGLVVCFFFQDPVDPPGRATLINPQSTHTNHTTHNRTIMPFSTTSPSDLLLGSFLLEIGWTTLLGCVGRVALGGK